jgi:hypothetical protein
MSFILTPDTASEIQPNRFYYFFATVSHTSEDNIMPSQMHLILGLVLLLGVNLTASMQITESDISFSSQLIEVIK